MKFKNIALVAAGAGALGLGVLRATPSDAAALPAAGLKICISLDKMDSPSRDGQLKLWKAEAAQLGVKKLIIEVAGEDAQRQSSQIDTCIAQNVAGIIAIPWDVQSILQDIDRAHAANIPVVTMDQAPADESTTDFFTGSAPHIDGLHAAQRLIAIVGTKPTKVVDLQGALDQVNGQERDQGFKDGIKGHPNITIVSEVPTNWHPQPALEGMENALLAHPDVGAVFAASDGLLPPVWSALKAKGKYVQVGQPGHVVVLSVDGDPQGCQSVGDGYMDAGYAQPFAAMTEGTFQAIIDIHNGKKMDPRIEAIPSIEYMPSDFDTMKKQVWGCIK
jgi:ribose transport system substrate-binding protein